jgi:pyruvate ferredoxin oxidoreductase gamma subunit/phenylglyoxylate dehydrogenase gamma subunit
MYELRMHGRGGQGAVMGAQILAKALLNEDKYAVTIPAFGFERRGAPVVAYLKFDDSPIRQHTNVRFPNIVMCIDPTLPNSVPIFDGAQSEATAILCTTQSLDAFDFGSQITKVGLCDGIGIAMSTIGRSITNTIMLGAFVKVTGLVSLESLNSAMGEMAFRDAALEKNIIAVKQGFDQTKVYEL